MYLDHCKSIEQLKQQYRAWTKKLHPDCGGTDAEMKALNLEYEKFFQILKDRHNATADEAHQTTETAAEFIEILEALSDIEAAQDRLNSLFAILDCLRSQQVETVHGSSADIRLARQIVVLESQIAAAERKLAKAQFESEETKAKLAA